MAHIPIIEARFFKAEETHAALSRRFTRCLHVLRQSPSAAEGEFDDDAERLEGLHLVSRGDLDRIEQRVSRLLKRRKAASGLAHLNQKDRDQLEVLKDGAMLIGVPSEHRADELAAALHAEMPWMAPATEIVWHAMRRSVREGQPGLRLPPLLLDGPPGIGKSHWARRLGEVIGTPTSIIEATGENASFGVAGVQRGEGSARPGRLLDTLLQTGIANPIMVVDEVEKAGRPASTKGVTFGLAEALLQLLEPMTARHWSCPYYQVRFDMSWVNWVLTANSHRWLPEPLLSRCPPILLRDLTSTELTGFVRQQARQRGISEVATEATVAALADRRSRGHRPSLRIALRLLQRAEDLDHAPIRQ